MFPISGVYEVAIRVTDLAQAERFYREVLELEVGIRDEARKWLFLRAGGNAGMIVLQEVKGEWPTQHFAFTIKPQNIERSVALLKARGVEVDGPHFHSWMPATSIYFLILTDTNWNFARWKHIHSNQNTMNQITKQLPISLPNDNRK